MEYETIYKIIEYSIIIPIFLLFSYYYLFFPEYFLYVTAENPITEELIMFENNTYIKKNITRYDISNDMDIIIGERIKVDCDYNAYNDKLRDNYFTIRKISGFGLKECKILSIPSKIEAIEIQYHNKLIYFIMLNLIKLILIVILINPFTVKYIIKGLKKAKLFK
jgi:hypothetical protein